MWGTVSWRIVFVYIGLRCVWYIRGRVHACTYMYCVYSLQFLSLILQYSASKLLLDFVLFCVVQCCVLFFWPIWPHTLYIVGGPVCSGYWPPIEKPLITPLLITNHTYGCLPIILWLLILGYMYVHCQVCVCVDNDKANKCGVHWFPLHSHSGPDMRKLYSVYTW